MKPKKQAGQLLYSFEVCSPGSMEPFILYESATPFGSIRQGDLLNMPDSNANGLLRVSNIEHILWATKGTIKHKTILYTESIKDCTAARIGFRALPARKAKEED
jgi:hypothetical protein